MDNRKYRRNDPSIWEVINTVLYALAIGLFMAIIINGVWQVIATAAEQLTRLMK